MGLAGLLGLIARDPAVYGALKLAGSQSAGERQALVGPLGTRPFVVASLAAAGLGDRQVLAVTATTREAEDLTAALSDLLDEDAVAEFPAWETLPHERLSPTQDTVGRRTRVLRRLAHPDPRDAAAGPLRVVVTGVRGLLQPIVAGLGDLEPVVVRAGDQLSLPGLVERLVALGYERTELISARGQVAVRGGIVDVFPPTDDHPVRLEFFGDEVEEIRAFSVSDQRSLHIAERGLWAPACRELPLTPRVRERAANLRSAHPELADVLEPISEGVHVEGMESLAPVLADGMQTLLELLAPRSLVLVCDPERVRRRAADLVATSEEFLEASWHSAAGGAQAPIDLRPAAYRTTTELADVAGDLGIGWWSLAPFDTELGAGEELSDFGADNDWSRPGMLRARPAPAYRGDVPAAMADIRAHLQAGDRVVIVAAGHGPAERITERLRDADLPARLHDDLEDVPPAHVVHVARAHLVQGFAAPAAGLFLLTEADLLGTSGPAGRPQTRMPSRRRGGIDPLQLSPGDFVVHEQHGVGRFVELTQRTVAGATREYLVLEYAASKRGQPPDRLFVPTDQLDQVTRYVGGEAPSVHRLGGADWQKAKGRARKAVREIAGELVRLYAARQAARGRAFGPDTPWQRELEDAFAYQETPDQQASIDEVKADMEKTVPMDRVVCGDVGYGKTEIAVRAAFKAVQDGTQVAVLVPTTLLVRQHYETFADRFAPFPVKVAALSRFQTKAEAEAVRKGITDGTVDVVIGTHRLLTPQTRFRNLGLVVVDEEQRFGVEHKEHLKALRTNVDVLTMSATPIPRTLEMAVTGIREMSTILTPPEQRLPVLTFVGPYSDKQVAAAIRRELLREGQVFFVHNRVESIDRVAARIRDLVPEARVGVGHGQMTENSLEQVMIDFWEKRLDVLVCTTIVESGLDIPNANTLILDRAETFGLSQLHQLRGRVGRGRERAYAYFLYPAERPLTETAHERLATIAQHSALGSGMAVAMKDLEIRGAGNLLGGEQSGHIADVGFDLYVRLVGEALAEATGCGPAEVPEVMVELPVNAHLPHDYLPDERLRLEAYARIAAASDEAEILAAAAELRDRYGPLPDAVRTLLEVARLRAAARAAGLSEIVLAGSRIRFSPVQLPESRALRLTRLFPGSLIKPATRTILVPRPMTARVAGKPLADRELLAWTRDLITAVLRDDAITASTPVTGGPQSQSRI